MDGHVKWLTEAGKTIAQNVEVDMTILERARATYGNKNQIMVCIEELNELACVLAKYPRYEDEKKAALTLYDKVLDEVADVEIILEHVKAIFEIDPTGLKLRKVSKLERLNRWLSKSNGMEQTTVDRSVLEGQVTLDELCGN